MKNQVYIQIKSLQITKDYEREEIETNARGTYQEKNGSHYLIFEEKDDENSGKTNNILKFTDQRLHMSKSGLVNVHMDFEKGKKSLSNYQTPFGALLLEIDTDVVTLDLQEKSLSLHLEYELAVNDEHQAKCMIDVTATE